MSVREKDSFPHITLQYPVGRIVGYQTGLGHVPVISVMMSYEPTYDSIAYLVEYRLRRASIQMNWRCLRPGIPGVGDEKVDEKVLV